MAKDETSLKTALFLLTIVGFNPRNQSRVSKTIRSLTVISAYFVITVYAFEIILNYQGVETIINVYILPHLITFLGTINMNVEQLGDIINHLGNLWPIDRHGPRLESKLLRNHKYVTILIKQFCFTIYAISIMTVYYCSAIKVPREPPFSCCNICDYESNVCYFLLVTWQIILMFFQFYPFMVGFDAIFLSVIVYTYNALELLREEIQLLQVTTNERNFKTILGNIIKEHNNILNFIDKLNRFFSMILLFLYCTALGCMTFALYMITYFSPPVPILVIEFSAIYAFVCFRMAAFCLGGSIILGKVTSIADEIFQLPWWISSRHRRDLSFIVMRSQRNDTISVGGVLKLGLPSFIELLRTTTSVYTMLKTIEK